jgi:peptidoglycan/LPS O-acetylase OafA/YrhL
MRLDGVDTSLDHVEFNGSEEVDQQMWFVIETITEQAWHWLPAITAILRFGAALISFVVAASVAVRRVRRWVRRRSRCRSGQRASPG